MTEQIITDETLVYPCSAEYCDDGYHLTAPIEEKGWLISGYSFEEYESWNGDLHYIPLTEGKVKMASVWRTACGTWFVDKPSLIPLGDLNKQRSFY